MSAVKVKTGVRRTKPRVGAKLPTDNGTKKAVMVFEEPVEERDMIDVEEDGREEGA